MKLKFRAEFFEEDGSIVGLCPELNVSSFGDDLKDAQRSLQEAVAAFLETCETLGTFEDILQETGFRLEEGVWVSRKPLMSSTLLVSYVSTSRIVPVHWKVLVKVFEHEGFRLARKKGDHVIMVKKGAKRPVVIKVSPREAPVTHIRTNLTTANITRERYFDLLERVR